MGVSDRMATDGQLYDGWGAEQMSMLNQTTTFQEYAQQQHMSHYDSVLLVAARAKQNAYEKAEVHCHVSMQIRARGLYMRASAHRRLMR